jgi:hypothetical protein
MSRVNIYNVLFYLFIACALTSVYIQTADLPIKQFTSPIIAGLVAVCAIIGILAHRLKIREGLILASAWTLAACGDVFFEMSRLSKTSDDAGRFFIIAVAIFLVAYLIFGVSFSVIGFRARLARWKYAIAVAVAAIMGVLAYTSLLVPAGQNVLVIVYTAQAVILLFGGLLCLMAGRYTFACIGIMLFFSDWLVGLRAFGNPAMVPEFVKVHILILILITYYIPMAASVDYSLKRRVQAA